MQISHIREIAKYILHYNLIESMQVRIRFIENNGEGPSIKNVDSKI